MAVQIIPQAPSFGQMLGQSLGTGLSQSLGALAQLKAQQLQQQAAQQQYAQAIQSMPGVTPQIANLLAAMSPQERKDVWPNLPAFMELAGLGAPQGRNEGAMVSQTPIQPQTAASPEAPAEAQGAAPSSELAQKYKKAFTSPATQRAEATQKREEEKLSIEKEKFKYKKEIEDKKFEYKKASDEEKIKLKKELTEKKDTLERIKTYEKFEEEIYKTAEGSDKIIDTLHDYINLTKTGDIINPTKAAILDKLSHSMFGLNLWGMTSTDTQTLQAMSKTFMSEAKNFFGSRVTQMEIMAFMQMFPGLLQSDEGKIQIAHMLIPMFKSKTAKREALTQVLEDTHGKRPDNFKELIHYKTKQIKDDAAQEFKALMSLPAPSMSDPNEILEVENGLIFKKTPDNTDWVRITDKKELDKLKNKGV
jgi:hypothetical protein